MDANLNVSRTSPSLRKMEAVCRNSSADSGSNGCCVMSGSLPPGGYPAIHEHPMLGMTADTEDELHAFAAGLGIRRDPGTPVGPQQELVTRHYLLTEGQRDRAVELGAQVITAREADKMERQR